MSRQIKGVRLNASDFYPTPPWCYENLDIEWSQFRSAHEPGKGDGRIKFAALINNKPSKVKVDYHGYEINKDEVPSWIVFPWEEWDK